MTPNVWKMFTNSPSTLTFCQVQKTNFPDWTINSWQAVNSIGCLLMWRANYRCVQSFTISVDVAKCVENVHTLIHYTHFRLLQKMTCLHWTIYSWQGFNCIRMSSYAKTNYRCVQSLNISVDVAKCMENHKFTQYTHFLSVAKYCICWHLLFVVSIRRHTNELKPLPLIRLFSQDKWFFCNRQKVSVLGEFVKIFHTFGDVNVDVEWHQRCRCQRCQCQENVLLCQEQTTDVLSHSTSV